MNMLESDELLALARRFLDLTSELIIRHYPAVRDVATDVVESLFCPRAVAKQLVLAIALETGAVSFPSTNSCLLG